MLRNLPSVHPIGSEGTMMRINELRERVRNGNYAVCSKAVATAMLERMLSPASDIERGWGEIQGS